MSPRESLETTVRELSESIGPRPSGSDSELEAARLLARKFQAMGFSPIVQTFGSASHVATDSSVSFVDSGVEVTSSPTLFSAPGSATGELVYLGTMQMPTAYAADLVGKIGLIVADARGHPAKRERLLKLRDAGLEALIVVSPYMDNLQTKAVRIPGIDRMPTVVISTRDANRIMTQVGHRLEVTVNGRGERAESQNVVAKIEGTSPNWLVVSAHYDTAPAAPGALDNASGVAVLLECARSLVDAKPKATIYFVATGSEEYGRLDRVGAGAQAFYDDAPRPLENCLGHLEIDDVGNRLGLPQVFIGGPKPFRDAVEEITRPASFRSGPSAVGCDHGAAEQRGIPHAWFNDSHGIPMPHYHSPQDTVEFIDFDKLTEYPDTITKVISAIAEGDPPYPFIRDGNRLMRPARHADIPTILNITRLAFEPVSRDKLREDLFGEKLGGKPWHEYKLGGMDNFLRRNIFQSIVCELDGKVVGYATYMFDDVRGIATIGNNAVHPDYHRQGIGQMMQTEVARRMDEEGFTKFEVTTLSVDPPAQRLYEKLGYREYCRGHYYLKPARDDECPTTD